MNNRSGCAVIILVTLGMVISSCTPEQPSPVPNTIEPSETLLSTTPTLMPATTIPEITITPSPTPSGYAGLSDGEYLLTRSQNGLEVISVQERSHFTLLNIPPGGTYLSQDQKQLVVVSSNHHSYKLINLETMAEEELPFLKDCYEAILSSDGTTFLAGCESPDYFGELFSISRDGKKKVQLTNCGIDYGDCGGIAYSPDGQWITYNWGLAGAGQSSKNGFYLTKSTCQDTEYKCGEMAIGPLPLESNYVWAPNGKNLACLGEDAIRLYEVTNNTILEYKELLGTHALFSRRFSTWSPDSTHLAYTTGDEIWLIDVGGGKPEFILAFNYDVYLIGWVKIKDGKVSP
jgi:hypothetical protein